MTWVVLEWDAFKVADGFFSVVQERRESGTIEVLWEKRTETYDAAKEAASRVYAAYKNRENDTAKGVES